MLIEFFLERARIELAADGSSYTGRVLDLPEIRVTGSTPDQCRANLAAAIADLVALEARGRTQYDESAETDPEETRRISEGSIAPSQSRSQEHATQEARSDSQALPLFTDIIYEKESWVARLTINRPAAYNAYTNHTLREMASAFRDAARDDKVAVLVLTGAGDRAFSAGGDVREHCEEHIGNPAAVREWMNALMGAHTALRMLGKPSIARINGIVGGGGNDWNLGCDLAIAADHARFVLIETKVGLVSAAGAAHWLPIVIGERRAREMSLTGEPISANKALLWGMVNDVVPYKQLDRTVDTLCQKLIDRFPESTRIAREQLGFWKDLVWNSMIDEATNKLTAHFAGEEAGEGLRALAEKREVDYRSLRANPRTVRAEERSLRGEAENFTASNTKTAGRSCYACGAQGAPWSFDYCGLCGTRLL